MEKHQVLIAIKKYMQFLRSYLFVSGFGLLVQLVIFTILRTDLGTNISFFVSYIFGVLTSFFLLSTFFQNRIRKKRLAILLQFLIGLVTFLINIVVLNLIDFSFQFINYDLYINDLDRSHYYALFSKIIASCIGFIWTSSMTGKFLFKKK